MICQIRGKSNASLSRRQQCMRNRPVRFLSSGGRYATPRSLNAESRRSVVKNCSKAASRFSTGGGLQCF